MGAFDFFASDPRRYTYADVERKNALADALFMQAATAAPRDIGSGLSALGAALGGALASRGAGRSEALRAAEGDAAFDAALNSMPQDNSPLAAALGGAFSTPTSTTPSLADVLAPSGNPLRDGIVETAQAIGADPVDLATAISYETAGTFDPTKAGPTTQWGQHRGLIQFGEPQARQYGVDWNDPIGSQLGADGAVANYMRDRGFKPGMSGMDLYSTINAGAPGRYGASDANNGGAPGDVQDKWQNQMAPHREKALSLLGVEGTATPAYAPLPQPAPVNVSLIRAMNNPYMTPEQQKILAGIYQQQVAQQITPYQQAQLAMEQQQHALKMQNALTPEPIEINGQLVDPATGQVLGDYRDEAGAGGTEYGLTPQYGVDAQGNPALIQIGKDGTAIQTALPEGVKFQKEPIRLDAGTEWVLLDPISRQSIGSVPKNIAQVEVEKAAGEARGAAIAAAPGDYQSAQNALGLIESLRNDPARGRGTGKSAVFNAIPGTAGYDFARKVDQAKGGALLTAIDALRGMGALSNNEGAAATAAVTRLDAAMTEEGFLEALADYEKIVRQGMDRAASKGGGPAAPEPTPPATEMSNEDLLKKYGG